MGTSTSHPSTSTSTSTKYTISVFFGLQKFGIFSNSNALLLHILEGFLAENVLCQPQFSHMHDAFDIYARIRLIRISAEIFVQPAEFSKKNRLMGLHPYPYISIHIFVYKTLTKRKEIQRERRNQDKEEKKMQITNRK